MGHKSKNFWTCTDVVRWQPIASLEFCYQFSPLLPPTEWCHRVFVSWSFWMLLVALWVVLVLFWCLGFNFNFRILVARTPATFPPNPSLTLLALFPRAFLVTTTTNAHTHISFACLRFKKNQFNDNINHPRRLNPTTFHFIWITERSSQIYFLKKHVLFQRHPRKERPTG